MKLFVLNYIKNTGIKEILIACTDDLKGLPQAIRIKKILLKMKISSNIKIIKILITQSYLVSLPKFQQAI
jgi:hypothetical protein